MKTIRQTELYLFIQNEKGFYRLEDLSNNQVSYFGVNIHFADILTSIEEGCGFDESCEMWFYDYNEDERIEQQTKDELKSIYDSQGQTAARYYADN